MMLKSKYPWCLSVSLMESQVSRVTTSTAHGVLMRGRQSISLPRYQGIGLSPGPGSRVCLRSFPELSSSQPAAWPGPGRHTLTGTSSTRGTGGNQREPGEINTETRSSSHLDIYILWLIKGNLKVRFKEFLPEKR